MGSNSTFFFSQVFQVNTSINSRKKSSVNPGIAEYHADELDKIQSLYYSKRVLMIIIMEKAQPIQMFKEVLVFYLNRQAREGRTQRPFTGY